MTDITKPIYKILYLPTATEWPPNHKEIIFNSKEIAEAYLDWTIKISPVLASQKHLFEVIKVE